MFYFCKIGLIRGENMSRISRFCAARQGVSFVLCQSVYQLQNAFVGWYAG
jgi:hypothetical protein